MHVWPKTNNNNNNNNNKIPLTGEGRAGGLGLMRTDLVGGGPPSLFSRPPLKELWAMVREHKTRSAQSAERNVARQWPTRP